MQSMVLDKESRNLFLLSCVPVSIVKVNNSVKLSFLLIGADQGATIFIGIYKGNQSGAYLHALSASVDQGENLEELSL